MVMAVQTRPDPAQSAPDPARIYERASPETEAGMGRLDNNKGTPERSPDQIEQAVTHKQEPRQLNAHEVTSERAEAPPGEPEQPDRSMFDEEPLGWDQAPTDIQNPRRQRHPRTEGKG